MTGVGSKIVSAPKLEFATLGGLAQTQECDWVAGMPLPEGFLSKHHQLEQIGEEG